MTIGLDWMQGPSRHQGNQCCDWWVRLESQVSVCGLELRFPLIFRHVILLDGDGGGGCTRYRQLVVEGSIATRTGILEGCRADVPSTRLDTTPKYLLFLQLLRHRAGMCFQQYDMSDSRDGSLWFPQMEW